MLHSDLLYNKVAVVEGNIQNKNIGKDGCASFTDSTFLFVLEKRKGHASKEI